ncbi:homeobox-leucine zipper protein HOX11 [Senna tora]|uniref:Homeobox-leucine zipper protein HOX11 n=1 Tax=Senna tora TaxID=362788 RepID=A0A834WKP4_9FABA|nr:homeobox-leucine zipper protein HOX11 [Senna tora]
MELGLSLGDNHASSNPSDHLQPSGCLLELGFNTTLSIGPICTHKTPNHHTHRNNEKEEEKEQKQKQSTSEEYIQLDLLPRTNPPSLIPFPWLPFENGSSSRGFDVNRLPESAAAAAAVEEEDEAAALSSSPNSAASSFRTDLRMYNKGGGSTNKRENSDDGETETFDDHHKATSSTRASDEDDNVVGSGRTRKKLRLSKEQSAFLEESFKEHTTLNPKQKLALANQLNLRPRQVEVWFQNRRARTKLKQTEVDCEYLKRCCETLTEENRRLHKELQELRALKTNNSNPFYMQLPATTLTMCPSCERVATNSNSNSSTITNTSTPKAINTNTEASATPIGLFPLMAQPTTPS